MRRLKVDIRIGTTLSRSLCRGVPSDLITRRRDKSHLLNGVLSSGVVVPGGWTYRRRGHGGMNGRTLSSWKRALGESIERSWDMVGASIQ